MDKDNAAAQIGAKIRKLRVARQITQAQLARQLHVAQSRLSDLERGRASFTAEQFLQILRIFNVPASEFAPSEGSTEEQLQNALARLGARHLLEADHLVPSERFREVQSVVREVLIDPRSPRMVTGLAPVLVEQADTINLAKLALDLEQIGLERRLFWLTENVLEVVRRELASNPDSSRLRKLRRAALVLRELLELAAGRDHKSFAVDVFDRSTRSDETLRELSAEASPISKRWNVATSLQVEDFQHALRQADGGI